MGSTYFSKRIFKHAKHVLGGRNRAKRPRTFSSEAAAKKWAEEQGIAKYTLVNLRNEASSQKKIWIEM